jgi:pimeloyl-ACP methyl ester carboxylesterase
MRSGAAEAVLVHGLWFGCWAMRRLAGELTGSGYATRCFDYASTRGTLDDHAEALHRFVQTDAAPALHLVGHSLGGLVILRLLEMHDELPPGRVVLLGSPLRGSRVARRVTRWPGAGRLIGGARGVLDDGIGRIPPGRETGMIAGSRPVGLGWLAGGTGGPGDGTVALDETRVPGLAAHCVLPVSHSGLVFSGAVARNAVRFLQSGRFDAPAA